MGSIRLPGKVMMMLDDKNPILSYVISQLQHCKSIEKIIVATTDLKEDDTIEVFTNNFKIDCFRGNSKDVLDRYYQCAKKFSISTIVRITADNPLIDPTLIENVIQKFQSGNFDYISNAHIRSFPYGTEIEIFSFHALEQAWKNSKMDYDREHVTPYFYNNSEIFRTYDIIHTENISNLRWTIDTIEDLKLVRIIVSKIDKRPILMTDILELINKEPELVKINSNSV